MHSRSRREANVITELVQLLGEASSTLDEELWFVSGTLLDVTNALMEDLPDRSAEPVCSGPDRGLIAESGQPNSSTVSTHPE